MSRGIALVGLGRWANAHVAAAGRTDAVEVVSCFDRTEEGRREFAARYGIPRAAESFEEILADPDVAGIPVPSLILHPLVENAIKHGMRTGGAPLQVRIEARRDHGDLRIEVANTGSFVAPERQDGTGIGLRNVSERLAQVYPGRHRLDVGQDGDWVRAIIRLEGEG